MNRETRGLGVTCVKSSKVRKSLTSIVCAEANFSRVRKEWQKFSLLRDGERRGN